MKLRLAQPALLVDIGRIGGLRYIRESGDGIHIGALTTHADVASSQDLLRSSPLLAQAASHIGDTQVSGPQPRHHRRLARPVPSRS